MTAAVDRTVPFERLWLDETSWVDRATGFVRDPDEVYEHLVATVPWQASRHWRYEKWVERQRVTHGYRASDPAPHPVLAETTEVLEQRYKVKFPSYTVMWYRDGTEGQAFHRDDDLRYCEDTLVAILTFGARRPWLLRRRTRKDKWLAPHGGAEHDLSPAAGDLFVLGGRAQADWEHSVPRVPGAVGRLGRISAQWRWTSGRGRPELRAPHAAPRHYTRR